MEEMKAVCCCPPNLSGYFLLLVNAVLERGKPLAPLGWGKSRSPVFKMHSPVAFVLLNICGSLVNKVLIKQVAYLLFANDCLLCGLLTFC